MITQQEAAILSETLGEVYRSADEAHDDFGFLGHVVSKGASKYRAKVEWIRSSGDCPETSWVSLVDLEITHSARRVVNKYL